MSDSVRPHRWQPTRLPRPWDSPGKNEHWSRWPFPSPMHESEKWKWSRSLATPWTVAYQAPLSMDFPGKSTGVGCQFLESSMTAPLTLLQHRDYGLPESTKSHVQISMKYSVILILPRGDKNLLRLSVSNITPNLFSVTTNQTNAWYKHQTFPLQDFFFFLILGCTKSDNWYHVKKLENVN